MIMAMAEYDEEPFTGTPSNYARLASELLGRKLTVRYINDTNRAKVAKWLKDRPAILIVPAKGYRKNTEYHAVYWTGDRLYDPNGSRPYKIDGKRAKMRMEEVWYIK